MRTDCVASLMMMYIYIIINLKNVYRSIIIISDSKLSKGG